MKHFTHKKAEFSRAASLSKSENTASNNSVFDTWCPELSKNGKCFFNFHHPTATTPTIPANNPFLYFSQFLPPYFASLLVRKTITTNPMNTLISISQPFFTSQYLHIQPSLQSRSKILLLLLLFSQFRLYHGSSLMISGGIEINWFA